MRSALTWVMGWMTALAATAGVTGAAASARPASGRAPVASAPAPLTVLTYNVEGLPWPVRWGRAAKVQQIATTLRTMRDAGRQPHVIVLQEAFTPAAKAIATEAGYRYVADGPARDDAGAPARAPADRAFAAQAGILSMERAGKWADSGLRIASDYPILNVRRMPFPAFACAGYDCLANKGALAVTVRVPGIAQPVAIVATHLNSRVAAHVSVARSLYAYQRQIDALGAFVRASVPADVPMVFAGDFNVGQHFDRRSYLVRNAADWRGAGISVAMDACLARPACATQGRSDIRYSYRRGKDWQFFSPGRLADLRVSALAATFGRDAAGAMLSDHVGYVATYLMRPLRAAAGVELAAR